MSDLIQRLKQRNVEKRSVEVSLDGRVLYLVDDSEAIQKQLQGQDLPLNHGLAYRDNISTDEMTPCLLYTSPSPRDRSVSRMPSSA